VVLSDSSPPVVAPLTVSQLNDLVAELVNQLGELQVEGEVSNFTASAAGHWYFSLKDERAQVACAMFGAGKYQRKKPANGDFISVTATPGLYRVRGSFQLLVSSYTHSGQGRLLARIAELQQALAREGLFDASHKLPLPQHANALGVVTSAEGAALTDIIQTCKRRAPTTSLCIYPCQVQGEGAAESIISAIALAEQHGACDALIIGRGGGSLEDLMAFNDESLLRAAYACRLPTLSAVGHERDFSLLDLVADARASTPTAAAEILTIDWRVWQQQADELRARFTRLMRHRLETTETQLANFKTRLAHPAEGLQQAGLRLEQLRLRLRGLIEQRVQLVEGRIQALAGQLLQLNPKRVLERGYALVTGKNGALIASRQAALAQEEVRITFADGHIRARPEKNQPQRP